MEGLVMRPFVKFFIEDSMNDYARILSNTTV